MFKFKKLNTEVEVASFWEKLYEYHREDAFKDMDEEDKEYFSGRDYYDAIMDLKGNTSGGQLPLEMVFVYDENDKYIGFIMYKIYNKEDGKTFILEFCIDKSSRNKGIGTQIAQEFEKYVRIEGATYLAINTSNENNRRFWQRFGFSETELDEWGKMIYTKVIS